MPNEKTFLRRTSVIHGTNMKIGRKCMNLITFQFGEAYEDEFSGCGRKGCQGYNLRKNGRKCMNNMEESLRRRGKINSMNLIIFQFEETYEDDFDNLCERERCQDFVLRMTTIL